MLAVLKLARPLKVSGVLSRIPEGDAEMTNTTSPLVKNEAI